MTRLVGTISSARPALLTPKDGAPKRQSQRPGHPFPHPLRAAEVTPLARSRTASASQARRAGGCTSVCFELGRKDYVAEVVGVLIAAGGEYAWGGVDSVAAHDARQILIGDFRCQALIRAHVVRIAGIHADHVGGAGCDRKRGGQVLYLPARGGLIAEGHRSKQRPGGGPDVAGVRAGFKGVFPETDACNLASDVALDERTQFVVDVRPVGQTG